MARIARRLSLARLLTHGVVSRCSTDDARPKEGEPGELGGLAPWSAPG